MTKVALISDIHFGVRKSSDLFFNSQMKFFREQFIPYLTENKIENVYFLGDVMDNRNHVNVRTMSEVYDFFRNDLKDFKVTVLLGNHDIYYKTTTEVNSLKFLSSLSNVTLIEDITYIENFLDTGKKLLMVPWVVDEAAFIGEMTDKNIFTDYCFGHFELSGFNLNKSMICDNGLNPSVIFENFGKTFSGHFHKRTSKSFNGSSIQYLGSPYQLTRSDKDEERGFCVLDVESGEYEFIDNTKSMKFITINYPQKVNQSIVAGNLIDVIIKYNPMYRDTDIQRYVKIIEGYSPAMTPSIKIERDEIDEQGNVIELKSMGEMLREYVSGLDIEKKDVVLEEILNLYRAFT